MSIEAPPAYDFSSHPALNLSTVDAKNAINNTQTASTEPLKKGLLEDVEQDPHAIQNRLLQALKALKADEALRDLTDTIHLINSSFATISIALGLLDDRNYRKKKADGTADGDIIEKFRPGWDQIKSDFNDLVWESKEVATTGAGHASKFGRLIVTILSQKEATLQEKKDELTQFIEELEASKTNAKNMSDKFSKLPDRITEVQTRVELALKEVGANFDAKLANVESLKKQISDLANEVTQYHNAAQAALAAASTGRNVTGVGAVLCLTGILAPAGFVVLVVGAVKWRNNQNAANEALKNMNDAEAKRLQKVAELDAITKSVADFKAVEAQVTLALKDTAGLSQRLLSIGNIWAAIRTETQLILEAIVSAQNAKTKWTFEPALGEQGVKAAYAKLEEVLILYSNGVSAVDPSHK